ncbi:MAG: glycoside hydrolase family 13, partial [Chloroflexi bacterium]
MIEQDISPHPGKVLVTFTIPCTIWADTIHLVGDFNDWNKESHPLVQHEDAWTI